MNVFIYAIVNPKNMIDAMKASKHTTFRKQFFKVPELDALHLESREWLSDIDFWKEEAVFLKKLIDKHFVHLLEDEGLAEAGRLSVEIKRLMEGELDELRSQVLDHEKKLARLVRHASEEEEKAFRTEHGRLSYRMREMAARMMVLKREVFKAMEEVLEEERVKALKA
ncbi:MAG: hypothetical protein D6730_21500 [Bacteroidetes bacterium]|nr:MAG: hypothetical protein D6730_21500 [Bacteroidota bacterium]